MVRDHAQAQSSSLQQHHQCACACATPVQPACAPCSITVANAQSARLLLRVPGHRHPAHGQKLRPAQLVVAASHCFVVGVVGRLEGFVGVANASVVLLDCSTSLCDLSLHRCCEAVVLVVCITFAGPLTSQLARVLSAARTLASMLRLELPVSSTLLIAVRACAPLRAPPHKLGWLAPLSAPAVPGLSVLAALNLRCPWCCSSVEWAWTRSVLVAGFSSALLHCLLRPL
jgi:hypothetical protein